MPFYADRKRQKAPGFRQVDSGAVSQPMATGNYGVSAAAPKASPSEPGARGEFVNLDEMLGLNKEIAGELGDKVMGDAEGKTRSASDGIKTAQSVFAGNRGLGTLSYNENGDAEAGGKGGYTGPKSLSQSNPDVYGRVQEANAAQQQASTQHGRAATLSEQQKKSQDVYGGGAASFDAFLGGQNAAPRLANLQSQYGDLDKMLGLAEDDAMAQATQATKDSDAASAKYRAKVENPGGLPTTPEESRKRDQQMSDSDRGTNYEDRNGAQGTKRIGDEQWANMNGMTLEQWYANGKQPPL